jgi:hypothetical protein
MHTDQSNEADGSMTLARGLVPQWAQHVALLCAMVATLLACLTVIFVAVGPLLVVTFSWEEIGTSSSQGAGGAAWFAWLLLSLAIYIPTRFRPLIGVTALLSAPVAVLAIMILGQAEVWLVHAGMVHAMLAATILLMYAVKRIDSPAWWVRRRLGRGACPRCLYDIRNLPSMRCPECGFGFGGSRHG